MGIAGRIAHHRHGFAGNIQPSHQLFEPDRLIVWPEVGNLAGVEPVGADSEVGAEFFCQPFDRKAPGDRNQRRFDAGFAQLGEALPCARCKASRLQAIEQRLSGVRAIPGRHLAARGRDLVAACQSFESAHFGGFADLAADAFADRLAAQQRPVDIEGDECRQVHRGFFIPARRTASSSP
jgi:hypothetical protein